MGKMIRIGHVDEAGNIVDKVTRNSVAPRRIGGGVLRSLNLGGRVKSLTSVAVDRGEQRAREALDDILPGDESAPGKGRGRLEDELDAGEAEEFAQGVAAALGQIASVRGPAAAHARRVLTGLVQSAGFEVGAFASRSHGATHRGPASGKVDIIGLAHDDSGGLAPDSDDEWR